MFNIPREFHRVGESLFAEFFDLSILVNEGRNLLCGLSKFKS